MVFGTRPEAIKLAPVIQRLREQPDLECLVCVTGQHRTMLDQVLAAFEIVPDRDLKLMRPAQTLAGLTAEATTAVDDYLATELPDLVLVQGDTTTTFCAALAAFYRRIPVGHVEAGLRTGNMEAPWPEEANRVLTTRLAALHFAPTERNRTNLLKEGVAAHAIHVTGNTVIDALFVALRRLKAAPIEVPGLEGIGDSPVVLITGHRRESFGQGFERICRAIAELAGRFPQVHFVYPVHLNPNVREPVFRAFCPAPDEHVRQTGVAYPNVRLIEPLEYLPFVAMMNRATLILTDSGGVQEEAPSLGKPVLVMRDTTERAEAVETGAVRLVGTRTETIVEESCRVLNGEAPPCRTSSPYGDGQAAVRIVDACRNFLRRGALRA